MAAFRFIAWLLVSIAVALLGADAVTSLETGAPHIRSTAAVLELIGINGQGMVDAAPEGIARALETVMNVPLWAVLGIVGVVLTLVFRPMD
jgi:flavin-binding protein dodecin